MKQLYLKTVIFFIILLLPGILCAADDDGFKVGHATGKVLKVSKEFFSISLGQADGVRNGDQIEVQSSSGAATAKGTVEKALKQKSLVKFTEILGYNKREKLLGMTAVLIPSENFLPSDEFKMEETKSIEDIMQRLDNKAILSVQGGLQLFSPSELNASLAATSPLYNLSNTYFLGVSAKYAFYNWLVIGISAELMRTKTLDLATTSGSSTFFLQYSALSIPLYLDISTYPLNIDKFYAGISTGIGYTVVNSVSMKISRSSDATQNGNNRYNGQTPAMHISGSLLWRFHQNYMLNALAGYRYAWKENYKTSAGALLATSSGQSISINMGGIFFGAGIGALF